DEIQTRLTAGGLIGLLERGEITAERFREEVNRRLETSMTKDQFVEMWVSIFTPGRTLVSERLIASLAERYRVILLSNTTETHYDWLTGNTPLLGHMHDYVLSYRVGAMKPQREIYEEAIRRAGCVAGECFFTDDVAAYVDGARACGIDAVQFFDEAQLRGE